MAQPETEIVTANEAFLIGVLQAVSGGSLFAAFSQYEPVTKVIGKLPFLLFLTLIASALMAAVLAAYWRHEYKKWNMKAKVSIARAAQDEARQRIAKANRDLSSMRLTFMVSLSCVVGAYGILIAAMWYQWAK